jgi:hypothetical protein
MAGPLSPSGSRTLALAALVLALVLAPTAGAATAQGPVAASPDAVQRVVGSVTNATAGVTDAVQRTTSQVTQPVTGAVAETTTRATEAVTRTVEETVSRARQVQPATDEAASPVRRVAAGVTRQAADPSAATVPSSSPAPPAPPLAAPRTRAPSADRGPERRSRTVPGVRPDRRQEHPAGARQPGESRALAESAGPATAVVPAAAPAAPRATGGRIPTVERAESTGSGGPYPDLPAEAGGSASALSTGLALGSLALLGIAICLTAPGLLRRLPAVPVPMRPVLLLYALERPG